MSDGKYSLLLEIREEQASHRGVGVDNKRASIMIWSELNQMMAKVI